MSSRQKKRHLLLTLLFSSLVSVGLYAGRAIVTQDNQFGFMVANLFLAWLPLVFVLFLLWWLRHRPWFSWQGLGFTVLWLAFLPNSFYIVSDLIHLHRLGALDFLNSGLVVGNTGTVPLFYDLVMFVSFAWNGFLLGFISLYLVHAQLLRRLQAYQAHFIVTAVLLLSSLGIYLGRQLRWNTWDLLVNPGGILFDLSERFLNPVRYSVSFITTALFFILLASIYAVIWQFISVLRTNKS